VFCVVGGGREGGKRKNAWAAKWLFRGLCRMRQAVLRCNQKEIGRGAQENRTVVERATVLQIGATMQSFDTKREIDVCSSVAFISMKVYKMNVCHNR
jgi:hypothetical protein